MSRQKGDRKEREEWVIGIGEVKGNFNSGGRATKATVK